AKTSFSREHRYLFGMPELVASICCRSDYVCTGRHSRLTCSKSRRPMSFIRSIAFAVVALVVCMPSCFAADGSQLKPPKGASVAIHVFEDMECPHCAHAYPLVWQ